MPAFIHLHSIAEMFRLTKQDTQQHPLIAVMDFSKVDEYLTEETSLSTDFYVLMFKDYCSNNVKYGRKAIDFHDGSLICMAPNQVLEIDYEEELPKQRIGWGLFIHPDLIRGTSLAAKMKDYSFFSYEVSEALHLSEKERQILYDCILKIQAELQENIDVHSQAIIVSTIELLLNYCTRFYGRQFITRKHTNHTITAQVEQYLSGYFKAGNTAEVALPTVKQLAEQVHLSPGYLSDLLKKETGKNAQDHIHFYLIEEAKNILLGTNKSIGEVAYALGFEYPQYFNKLFKQKTGKTPLEFRNMN